MRKKSHIGVESEINKRRSLNNQRRLKQKGTGRERKGAKK